MSSSSNRNFVIIGGDLWADPSLRSETSFCKHIEHERRRAGRDIEIYSLSDLDLGIRQGELFLRLPDGSVLTKHSPNLPKWALLYVVPPRVSYMLEQMGVICYSSYEMSSILNDKMRTHILFADNFEHPDTLFYGADKTINSVLFDKTAYPFMLKGVTGQGGINVSRVENIDETLSFVEEKETETELIMLQKAMPKADDVRVYCLGDEIIGSVLRHPKEGIWKANLEFSPQRSIYELGKNDMERIQSAMNKLPSTCRGLYSFDFLFDENENLVLCEANCNVGTNGLDAVGLGKDLFLRYVDYIRRDVQKMGQTQHKLS